MHGQTQHVRQWAVDWAFSNAARATTIWHRLSMFGATALMSQTERQAEAARMVGEKIAAAYEGGWKASLAATEAMWGARSAGSLR